MKFQRSSLIFFAALFSFSLTFSKENSKLADPAIEPEGQALTLLTESQVRVKPDLGVVSLHFTAYGWTVDKARKKADKLIQKFLERLAQEKIVTAQVTIGEAKLKPSYQFNRDLKANVPADFLITRRVTLQLEDLGVIDKIMDASISVGSFFLESLYLTVKDSAKLERQALQKAVQEGQKKAEEIAKGLGASVKGIQSLEEQSFEMKELDLIQDQDFSTVAASALQLQNLSFPPSEEKEESADADPSADASMKPMGTDWIQARSKVKVTFLLK